MTPSFLLVLVPLLPLLAALATVIAGRRLGARAHLPAVVGIAAAAVVALSLLVVTARSRGNAETPRPIDVVAPLWQWATVEDAYAPASDSHAAVPGTAVGEDAYSARPFSISIALRLDPLTATMLELLRVLDFWLPSTQ